MKQDHFWKALLEGDPAVEITKEIVDRNPKPPVETLPQVQLSLHRNPNLINRLAHGTVAPGNFNRSPENIAKPVQLPDDGRVKSIAQPGETAEPALWAEFILSGPGR